MKWLEIGNHAFAEGLLKVSIEASLTAKEEKEFGNCIQGLVCWYQLLELAPAHQEMGPSLSLISSAWNEILNYEIFGVPKMAGTFTARSVSFGRRDGELFTRAVSFKENESESFQQSKEPDEGSRAVKQKIKKDVAMTNLVVGKECNYSAFSGDSYQERLPKSNDPELLPKTLLLSTPRPVSALDVAATNVQKVYRSYRTRRNLADCAVVVEELWWKALDFAALSRSSVSFFDINKHETAVSKWARVRTKAAKVGKGLLKDEKAQKLALQHWLEAIDPRHRYGHNLHFYYDVWSTSKSIQPFFFWLDVGDGKELNHSSCPRANLQCQCIKYLGPKEREAYEVTVEDGKLVYRQSGKLLDTDDGSKWIFVLSTSRALYVGQKKKGVFQHSSFLSGGATTAAGRLVAHDGILEAIWPYSGHYLPTEDNFKEFISFLEEHHVDLTNVKRCAVDDDRYSFKEKEEETTKEIVEDTSATATSTDAHPANSYGPCNEVSTTLAYQADDKINRIDNTEEPKFDLAKRLSCKWTSGVGPRIGCVRDYPMELQSQALEKVNLSPTVPPRQNRSCIPIPSPRPSPKICISPRLASMVLPIPGVSATAAS